MEDLQLFGSSPSTVSSFPTFHEDLGTKKDKKQSPLLCLQEFVRELPNQIARRKDLGVQAGCQEDPIMELFA